MFKLFVFLFLAACAPSPAEIARPHGSAPIVMYDCPEVDPAQPRCKVTP